MKRLSRHLWLAALCAACWPGVLKAQYAYYGTNPYGQAVVVPASAYAEAGTTTACP